MIRKLLYFLTLFRERFRKQNLPSHITVDNFLPADEKKKCLNGTISLCHCHGHDCIMLVFYFDGFYDNHTRLLSENNYSRRRKWVVLFQYLKTMTQILKLMIAFPLVLIMII